jgi:hypothetical protein
MQSERERGGGEERERERREREINLNIYQIKEYNIRDNRALHFKAHSICLPELNLLHITT